MVLVIGLVIAFNFVSKPAAAYIWFGQTFINFLMNQLKSLYAEPRPYWVSDEIKAWHCGTSFGNPSGHMIMNSFFWVTAYLHVYHSHRREDHQQDSS